MRGMYNEFVEARRAESMADWFASRHEHEWSAFWFAPRVDAHDSSHSGEFLHPYLGAITATFGHGNFPAHYELRTSAAAPRKHVAITYAGAPEAEIADYFEEFEQLRFDDGRVWTRYHDARSVFTHVVDAAAAYDGMPKPQAMHELLEPVDGEQILAAVRKAEGALHCSCAF